MSAPHLATDDCQNFQQTRSNRQTNPIAVCLRRTIPYLPATCVVRRDSAALRYVAAVGWDVSGLWHWPAQSYDRLSTAHDVCTFNPSTNDIKGITTSRLAWKVSAESAGPA